MNARAQGSLVQEMVIRPTIIGKIKLGIQVLTFKTAQNPRAVQIYNQGVERGMTFAEIERQIQQQCDIKNGLCPSNTEYLTISKNDFTDPASVDYLLEKYGEDRNGERRIYKLPIVFPYGETLLAMPHRFACYNSKELMYSSEYRAGKRYCTMYEPFDHGANNTVTRKFGPRIRIVRQDEHIDGLCDPEGCPQFQKKACQLDLSLQCLIPGLKGAGIVQIHSTSSIALRQWYSTLDFVERALGSIRNVEFFITKKLMDTTYMSKDGVLEKSKAWITVLNSSIDIPDLMNQVDDVLSPKEAISAANQSVALLENEPSPVFTPRLISNEEQKQRYEKFQQYLKDIQHSDKSPLEKALSELKVYLKYLNVSLASYNAFASAKHGSDWTNSLEIVQSQIKYVSTRTEAEMHVVLSSN